MGGWVGDGCTFVQLMQVGHSTTFEGSSLSFDGHTATGISTTILHPDTDCRAHHTTRTEFALGMCCPI